MIHDEIQHNSIIKKQMFAGAGSSGAGQRLVPGTDLIPLFDNKEKQKGVGRCWQLGLVEELAPGTDLIPTATIG